MFEKSLNDLVRGIRAHKGKEPQYIGQCMIEIKKELKTENIAVKTNAIAKLIYLQMVGYDITWAAFNIVEVMSSTKFTFKRTGYLAAAQCFHEGVDVVMLTTNMIRKDISAANLYDASLALNGLGCFMTSDLARDLANDVLMLTSSSRPYLRKKSILVMYKVFLKFPDALRPAFSRLKERLEDPDTGVQSAAVSVICELARKNPRNYLSLAPTFFKLMTNSSNNWMLIKIIKLFGSLAPLEPRLSKKLVEPLTSLIHSTTAMSLLYECISTVISGMPSHTPSIQLCVSKLRLYIEDADQNLKYLGLLAMSKILKCQPKAVQQHKDLIMDCLDDADDSIRLRSLDLIAGMVSKKNLPEIVKKMLVHCDQSESSSYRDEVMSKIIHVCSQNSYQYISNFDWYITVLVEMTRFEGTRQGHLIAGQMLDVTVRVRDVRPFSVKQMATILENSHLFTGSALTNGISEVLYAAAWIVGEFSEHLSAPRSTIDSLLNSKVTALPGHIQAVFVQNIVKLYASVLVKAEAEGTPEVIEEVGGMLVEKLPVFMQSGDLEVQERACCIIQLMKYIVKLQGKGAAVAEELTSLFAGDLNPVAPKAQKKVPIPAGLDLDKWIHEPPESEDEKKQDTLDFFLTPNTSYDRSSPSTARRGKRTKGEKEEEEEIKKYREQRKQAQLTNPHYLKSKASPTPTKGKMDALTTKVDVSSIPVSHLELGIDLVIDEPKPSPRSTKKGKKEKKGKRRRGKGRRGREEESSEEEKVVIRPVVNVTQGELPEGAVESDGNEADGQDLDDVSKALNQNLDMPLRDDEILPVPKHHVVHVRAAASLKEEAQEKEQPKKKGKEKERRKRKGKDGKDKEHRKKKKDEEDNAIADSNPLVDITEDKPPQEEDAVVALDTVALDMVTLETKEAAASPANDKKKRKHRSKDKAKKEKREEEKEEGGGGRVGGGGGGGEGEGGGGGETEEGDLDDLEFWLSTAAAGKKEAAPPPQPVVAMVDREEAAGVLDDGKRKKKERKGRKEKSPRKKQKGEGGGGGEGRGGGGDLLSVSEGGLLDVEFGTPQAKIVPVSNYKLLAEDENLKMTYEIQANPLYSGQVTVGVVFSNQSDSQLVSIEFNVLDSLNAKMERPMGHPSHEGIKVPFQLPPATANECQMTFYVKSFQVPQKLRGTVTYMAKGDSGTASDKIDFFLHLPCSAFICPVPCVNQHFSSLLSGGSLCDTQSITQLLANTADFTAALVQIRNHLRLSIVEHIDTSASLYGVSIGDHHICLLVKATAGNKVTVNAKGSDSQLISNLLDEIKALV